VPLKLAPVQPAFDGPERPMVWDIAMAVRNGDRELRDAIDAALQRRRADVAAILAAYGVPQLDLLGKRTEAR
jgi:mxaJ protein